MDSREPTLVAQMRRSGSRTKKLQPSEWSPGLKRFDEAHKRLGFSPQTMSQLVGYSSDAAHHWYDGRSNIPDWVVLSIPLIEEAVKKLKADILFAKDTPKWEIEQALLDALKVAAQTHDEDPDLPDAEDTELNDAEDPDLPDDEDTELNDAEDPDLPDA